MSRKLTGTTLESTPVVSIKAVPDTYFKGKLLNEGRSVKMKKGKSTVYEFELIDTDMGISNRDENKNYVETSVEEGDKVSVFAPTVLAKALLQAKVGEIITIRYLGKSVSKESGVEYHNFDVEAE